MDHVRDVDVGVGIVGISSTRHACGDNEAETSLAAFGVLWWRRMTAALVHRGIKLVEFALAFCALIRAWWLQLYVYNG